MFTRTTAVALSVLTLLAGLLTLAGSADAAVHVPGPGRGMPAAIEPQSIDYVEQTSCDPAFKPGTAALGRLLSATYPGITVQGAYSCGTDGRVSEHYEGRAIDWMTSARVPSQARNANTFISWLLATDKAGNRYAMARRLGVMYLIWNNRIWGGWDGTWQPYGNCARTPQPGYDNSCHRTHVHLSLTWNGAQGRTSYWTSRVTGTDFGPCRPKDLNWAAPYSRYNPAPCPAHSTVTAPRRASATLARLYPYSGATLRYGATGPAVAALQSAVGVAPTGNYLNVTRAAVAGFQRSRRLPASGVMDTVTWRVLLAALAPR